MARFCKIGQTHLRCRIYILVTWTILLVEKSLAVISFVTLLDSPDTCSNVAPCLKREKERQVVSKASYVPVFFTLKSWNPFYYYLKTGTTYFSSLSSLIAIHSMLENLYNRRASANSQAFFRIIGPFIGMLLPRIDVNHFNTAWLIFLKFLFFVALSMKYERLPKFVFF